MLKIKDNVDLKELEKYGIKYYAHGDNAWFIQDEDRWFPAGLMVNELTREICLHSGEYDISTKQWTGKHTTILYDLLKDGLVVKVDE